MTEADLAYYSEHDEWLLRKPVKVGVRDRFWRGALFKQMVMDIKIERRHLFYTIILLVPNVLLYAMSGLVFLLPVESGEKVSFSITILLAEMVAFSSISDNLPSSSLTFPRLAWLVCVVVVQIALSSLLAIIGKYRALTNLLIFYSLTRNLTRTSCKIRQKISLITIKILAKIFSRFLQD